MVAVVDSPMHRVALAIQYLGTRFHGWQRQSNGISVQQTIEDILTGICKHKVVLHAAGRTDTGVHASGQVAHFDTNSPVPPERWAKVLNAYLPADILIKASVAVSSDWHARFSATWRRYRYTIFTNATPNLFVRDYSWHYYLDPLDRDLIQAAIAPMLGKQHLAAFQRAGSKRPHAWLTVQEAICWREGDFVYLEMQASGFLYGMMRLLVGMLVEVGRSRLSVGEFTRIWQQQRRCDVKYAAPPQGLCLLGVGYNNDPFAQISADNITADRRQRPVARLPGEIVMQV
ncbi:tRNA pseudouridine(38-40) synthase TruA [Pseudanabaena sp. PCC 6802]|uniref:tRNA pseudouridine(38-40) synthase TruA n=1 Tax=Pseudanabaena sp. PCC 6802 TaxID=118173 RepID=UPI0003471E05|nr:tRNA pseudouridine(38-40) synthase TruA [Pseudanabaena sp. PCC 6802]